MRFGAPPDNPPAMWPFVLGTTALLGVLSYFSLKGQREIHARVERDRAERRRRGESW
jgi:hypothetical protein